LVEREKPYIAAARILGLGKFATLFRHVLPNVIKAASLVVLLLLAQAVLLESALSYLGAGPQRPFATWVGSSPTARTTSPPPGGWSPGRAWSSFCWCRVNLLGDGLRDRPAGSSLRGLLNKFRPKRAGA